MTSLHLLANYLAVSSLVFETLNKDRLLILLDAHCNMKLEVLPSLQRVNAEESPFLGFGKNEEKLCGKRIHFGASLTEHIKDSHQLSQIKEDMNRKHFVVFQGRSKVDVCLSGLCDAKTRLQAYSCAFHSALETKDTAFDYGQFEQKLLNVGWRTSHLQMASLGWKGEFL